VSYATEPHINAAVPFDKFCVIKHPVDSNGYSTGTQHSARVMKRLQF
jgi:hypothetical protein